MDFTDNWLCLMRPRKSQKKNKRNLQNIRKKEQKREFKDCIFFIK